MLGRIERWPPHILNHFLRHFWAGTKVVASWPRETREESYFRAGRHMKFYYRLLRHMVKMHPDFFTDPWLRRLVE